MHHANRGNKNNGIFIYFINRDFGHENPIHGRFIMNLKMFLMGILLLSGQTAYGHEGIMDEDHEALGLHTHLAPYLSPLYGKVLGHAIGVQAQNLSNIRVMSMAMTGRTFIEGEGLWLEAKQHTVRFEADWADDVRSSFNCQLGLRESVLWEYLLGNVTETEEMIRNSLFMICKSADLEDNPMFEVRPFIIKFNLTDLHLIFSLDAFVEDVTNKSLIRIIPMREVLVVPPQNQR